MKAALAALVAVALAAPQAWGHSFPPVRTVVVQVEACQVVLLVGYRPGTGESTASILAQVASQPKSHGFDALRDVLATHALAPLAVEVDGLRLVPTAVRAKVGAEPGGARPMVVLLVTYALPTGSHLSVTTADPRSTRISWQDRSSGRVALGTAPAQDHYFDGVASFLLSLDASTRGSVCATPLSSSDSASPSR